MASEEGEAGRPAQADEAGKSPAPLRLKDERAAAIAAENTEDSLRRRKHSLSLAISACAPGEPGPVTVLRAAHYEAYLRGDQAKQNGHPANCECRDCWAYLNR